MVKRVCIHGRAQAIIIFTVLLGPDLFEAKVLQTALDRLLVGRWRIPGARPFIIFLLLFIVDHLDVASAWTRELNLGQVLPRLSLVPAVVIVRRLFTTLLFLKLLVEEAVLVSKRHIARDDELFSLTIVAPL